MNRKAISKTILVGIIVVVLVVAAVGVYYFYYFTRPKPVQGALEFSTLTVSPSSIAWGAPVTVTVKVHNTGETDVTGNVTITLSNTHSVTKTETLAGNETKTVTFNFSNGVYTAPGTYTVTVPGTTLQKTFDVSALAQVGLVLATGGLGDKSFNDISYAGVQKASDELGIEFDYVEPKAIAEYEGFQRDFAKTGEYAIIICIGFDQADALNKTAADYPDQKFAIVDMVVNQPNVASLLFKTNEGSFLVGVVAGMKTQSGKVGFVGGMDIPLIRDFFEGYQAGVKWANSSATILPPVFVGGWADPTKGNELALGLADLGADAIFVAAGKSGLGALDAIHTRGITGLGVDACQCYLYPEIKASMTKRVDVAVFDMINATMVHTFQGGIFNKGLADQWVGTCRLPSEEAFWEAKFSFTHATLETAVTDKITEAKDKIVAGEITVPTAY